MASPHIGFVLAAYGLAAGVLAGLTAAVWLRHRRTARQLSELEAGGAPRRRRATEPRP
ncbi:MAG TPA: heme exporter protein CcmD [Aestuariivirgaceae bacterium]|nr:heme exporter protein CcmD [Aestuariivirgaceae bacterium]